MSRSTKHTEGLEAAKLFDLTGKVALVTGGSRGIGSNGCKVYIVARDQDGLDRAVQSWSPSGPGQLIAMTCDVRSKSAIEQLAKDFAKVEDQLDILVNNSGIAGPKHEIEKGDQSAKALQEQLWNTSQDDWSDVLQTNVTGMYFMSVAFVDLLSKSTAAHPGWSAAIVQICSISGHISSSQHHIPYNASKAAALGVTRLLASEFCREGVKVRVNSISPGIFPSEMTAKESDETQKSYVAADGYRQDKNIAAGRPGNERDMAMAALTLACNQYMVGADLVVDGGYMLGNP